MRRRHRASVRRPPTGAVIVARGAEAHEECLGCNRLLGRFDTAGQPCLRCRKGPVTTSPAPRRYVVVAPGHERPVGPMGASLAVHLAIVWGGEVRVARP